MQTRQLGATGLIVSELGLGAGWLGDPGLDDAAAERLIRTAVDLGVTLIDTAPSYGLSEVRVGAALRGMRSRVLLSTKLVHGVPGSRGVPGIADWTGASITAGIEASLARLGTAWLDLVHLCACPLDVLERGDVIEALDRGVRAGKVRVAAYDGDGDALAWAIDSGRFGAVQCSVSLADQRALDAAIPRANLRGVAVLAKRPLASAAWHPAASPEAGAAPDRTAYRTRLRAMDLPPPDVDPADHALRFVLAQPVASVLVGTADLAHLRAAVASASNGPLEAAAVAHARDAFRRHDRGWDAMP